MNRRSFLQSAGIGTLATLAGCRSATRAAGGERGPGRPNIIVILVDDMGFSDIGCYGGEIATPNLDRLAARGIRFTQFYNTGRCCPTRASLLTGLYPHQAGVGHMTADKGLPGYVGHLHNRCVTIGEVLRPAGYFTIMTGKWHVGARNPAWWPSRRGFDRTYACPEGGGFYFQVKKGRSIVRNGKVIHDVDHPLPEGWYSTDAWTDEAIGYIDEAVKADKPFFAYLAHNAPHFPLQAPPADIERYRRQYMGGWDNLRQTRYGEQVKSGLIEKRWPLSPRDDGITPWDQVDAARRDRMDHIMAIYAATVDRMDKSVGRLVQALKQRGVLENSLILFLSDNGGNAESGPWGRARNQGPLGSAASNVFCGKSWANAENTPFRLYKHWVHEGGISTPLIAHWPAGIPAGRHGAFEPQPGHLIDIMATCVDLAEATYPKTHNGHDITPMQGVSLAPAFRGKDVGRTEPIYFEHEGNRAIRDGKWKLVAKGAAGEWELYDMEADRSELHNLASEHPDRVQAMAERWETFARKAHMLPWPYGGAYAEYSKKTHFELAHGDRLQRFRAPMVAGKAVRISATATVRGDGVLVAQGGSSLGWSFYVKDGRLAFATRHRDKRTVAQAAEPLGQGRVEASARLAKDGAITVAVGGKEVARAKAPGPIPEMPLDGLEVGRDDKGAAGDYEAPNRLKGKVETVVIDIEE